MPITTRTAGDQDIPFLIDANLRLAAETEDHALDAATVDAGVRGLLAHPARGFYLLAEVDGTRAGSLLVTFEWSDWRNGTYWWIQSVYVTAPFRRQGVFSTLSAEVENRARAATGPAAVGLRLYVHAANDRARSTYAALGFTDPRYGVLEKLWRP